MGLTGPQGVLPLPYSALVVERMRERDTSMRDFFDIFNHRMISLFYQAWEKYRFTIPYERGERDRFSHHLLALIGLGTPGLQNRLARCPTIRCSFMAACSACIRARRSRCGRCCWIISRCRWRSNSSWARGVRSKQESQCSLGRRRHVFRAPGLRRGGGRRGLGSAVAACASVGPYVARAVSGFSSGGEAYQPLTRAEHSFPATNSIWKFS